MVAIAAALQACRKRIADACLAAGRADNCAGLVAVSKTFPAAAVREAHTAGQRVFGESYLQEALPKLAALADLALEWHFIGPVQGNKTRQIAAHFAWVHGVDRLQIAQRLSQQRPAGMPPLQVCIQVNVSGEASKSGVAPEQALALARATAAVPNLRLRGFMAIPEPGLAARLQHERFRQVADLLQAARAEGLELDTLSMGMSADLEAAIAEGATWVRVGTAIFGERQANDYNRQEQVS
jgi:pyridoxal phosphate enzyme (YggS family)